MSELVKFNTFLESVDLKAYRAKYRPIKLVEMDLPKNIQALDMLYKVYWDERRMVDYETFYEEYLASKKDEIEAFRVKITMCEDDFYRGLRARIYRTWASIITQIQAGYVAKDVFEEGSVNMSALLDHQGADFQVKYKKETLNYQVKKKTFSGEVRKGKGGSKNKIAGEFIDLSYEVPSDIYFESPKKKNGDFRLPYLRFNENKTLERLKNGFVVFTREAFIPKKNEIDNKTQNKVGAPLVDSKA